MNVMMLQERNFNKILLTALLIGAVSTASAWTDMGTGTNLEYEIVGTVLRLQSPDPTQSATIVADVFTDNTTITSVTLPSNVTTIEGRAFMGCTSLASVDFGNVQSISSNAFSGCTSLAEIVIPPTVTNIGVEAFKGCSALKDVLCRPFTAPALGTDAFTNCHSSLQICVPALGTYRDVSNWNSYYEQTKLTDCAFLDEYDQASDTEGKISAYRTDLITDIDIFRTLRKAGCFNTLTLPFNVPDLAASPLGGDNVEVYTFSSATVENGTLQLEIEKVTSNSLTAGTPYLIQWTNTTEVLNRMHFTGITWDDNQTAETASSTHVNYVGFYGRTHIDDDANHSNLFLKGNNTLYWPAEGDATSMLGFRAYFHVNTSGPSLAPIYRGMPAALRIKSTPTGVESPSPLGEGRGEAAYKELRNGQLVIIRNGETFSLNGQKL